MIPAEEHIFHHTSPSLAEMVRNVDVASEQISRAGVHSHVNKQEILRKLIEREEQKNLYLHRVREEKRTLAVEYERIFGNYNGWNVLFPERMPKELRQDGIAFHRICGNGYVLRLDDSRIGQSTIYLSNPVSLGVSMGLLIGGFYVAMYGWGAAGAALAGIFLGGMAGVMISSMEANAFYRMRENAAYLDKRIQEAYK